MMNILFLWHLVISSYRFCLALRDLLILKLPFRRKRNASRIGFLIHDRDGTDVYRWFPILQYFPKALQEKIRWWLWPFKAKKITTNLCDSRGERINGWLLSVILTAEQMVENHSSLRRARQKIDQLFKLADRMGLSIVGLGAYSASITKLGKSIKGRELPEAALPTTGHAFTVAALIRNAENMAELLDLDFSSCIIAIVGVGSIGATCARVLTNRVSKIILVDISLKEMEKVAEELIANAQIVETSDNLSTIKQADIVITATTTPEAILRQEHLRPGMVIIDDAQPRNIDEGTAYTSKVLVIDGGVVYHEGINTHFDFGLYDFHDMWGCLCESILLAAIDSNEAECTIGFPSPEMVEELDQKFWGLDKINQEYKEFISQAQKIHRQKFWPLAAKQLEQKFYQIYQKDPHLPKQFLLDNWYGNRAYKIYREIATSY